MRECIILSYKTTTTTTTTTTILYYLLLLTTTNTTTTTTYYPTVNCPFRTIKPKPIPITCSKQSLSNEPNSTH